MQFSSNKLCLFYIVHHIYGQFKGKFICCTKSLIILIWYPLVDFMINIFMCYPHRKQFWALWVTHKSWGVEYVLSYPLFSTMPYVLQDRCIMKFHIYCVANLLSVSWCDSPLSRSFRSLSRQRPGMGCGSQELGCILFSTWAFLLITLLTSYSDRWKRNIRTTICYRLAQPRNLVLIVWSSCGSWPSFAPGG